MTGLYIILLLSTLLLSYLGSLPPVFAVLLILYSGGSLLYESIGLFLVHLSCKQTRREEKAKWAGSFRHYQGLALPGEELVHLLISRRDELVIRSDGFDERFELTEVSGFLVLKAGKLDELSDARIFELLNAGSGISLHLIREQINRNPVLRRRQFFFIALKRPREEPNYPKVKEFILLESLMTQRAMQRFLKRAEIFSKVCQYKGEVRRRLRHAPTEAVGTDAAVERMESRN